LKSLYWRIYLMVVVLLAVFAFGSGWLYQQQIEHERGTAEASAGERLRSMAVLLQGALPAADAPREVQAKAVRDWGQRLRLPLGLENAAGERLGVSEMYEHREGRAGQSSVQVTLDDGRRILFLRSGRQAAASASASMPGTSHLPPSRFDFLNVAPMFLVPRALHGEDLLIVLILLFVGIAAGSFPVVRGLTRRLEALKVGVQAFGDGQLHHRVDDRGRDEVAQLARSFNEAAARIEALLHSHQTLLANASHELRSPLARLKMAFAMLDGAPPALQERMQSEIHTNIAELDALVEEVLLASRLEAGAVVSTAAPVDMLSLAIDEAGRTGAQLSVPEGQVLSNLLGEERLLRRALRNLLENARRYGGNVVELHVAQTERGFELRVCDRGPGVPEDMRERIFEPFFRLPGHAEMAGGVGLGLSLVKQIAARHHGEVRCEARPGGGSVFVLSLPFAAG